MADGHRVVETPTGLLVETPRRPPLVVALEPWGFVAGDARFALTAVLALGEHLAAALARAPRTRRPLHGPPRPPPHAWTLAGHALRLRQRRLPVVNPTAAAVLDAVDAVTDDPPALAGDRTLYDDAWLVRDVVRHRAAAIALGYVHRLRPDADAAGRRAALARWRDLFSPTGVAHRSLDRTLMNLAASVPAALVPLLRHVRLSHPVTDPVVLTTLCLAVEAYARLDRLNALHAGHAAIFQRADAGAIVSALAVLSDAIGLPLRADQPEHLRRLVQLVADDPAPYGGALPGLVARAIRHHRGRRVTTAPIPATSLRTARPPIPLPEVPGIRFLDTVAAIRAEAAAMDHCIADYADGAVGGRCYLFSVTHRGTRASIEVSPEGRVVQACGPRNTDTIAAHWGTRHLRRWARALWPPAARLAHEAAARRRAARRAAMAAPPPRLL